MLPQISDIISAIPIRDIAIRSNFVKRSDGKITPLAFVISFYLQIASGAYSHIGWAQKLSLILNATVSSQSISAKLSFRHLQFAKELLKYCLAFTLQKSYPSTPDWLSGFNRIIVTDSTCLSMPKIAQEIFPGSYSKKGNAATAKLQVSLELKSDKILSLDIESFRDNDQSYANSVIEIANIGDLVIRDLGYFTSASFLLMKDNEISFISKLKANVHVLDNHGVKIDLLKKLNKAFKNNIASVDWKIQLSQKYKIPLRLVAFKVNQKTFQVRKEKAKSNRHTSANHSLEYMERLSYTIYVTNVKKETLKAQQIHEAYGLRWRIESIFKSWKSNLNLQKIFLKKTFIDPAKPQMLLYLALSTIVLYQNNVFTHYRKILKSHRSNPNASVFKIPALINNLRHVQSVIPEDFIVQYFSYYGRTSSRKGKNTYLERLYAKN